MEYTAQQMFIRSYFGTQLNSEDVDWYQNPRLRDAIRQTIFRLYNIHIAIQTRKGKQLIVN